MALEGTAEIRYWKLCEDAAVRGIKTGAAKINQAEEQREGQRDVRRWKTMNLPEVEGVLFVELISRPHYWWMGFNEAELENWHVSRYYLARHDLIKWVKCPPLLWRHFGLSIDVFRVQTTSYNERRKFSRILFYEKHEGYTQKGESRLWN